MAQKSRPAGKPAGTPPSGARKPAAQPTPKQSAREKLAAERAAAAAKAKRRRAIGIGAGVAAVILVVIGVMVLVSLPKPAPSAQGLTAAEQAQIGDGSYVTALSAIPAATLDAVGAGSIAQVSAQQVPNGQPVLKDGKPRVLYIGADYCPYCGLERWPLTIALSRFGTFTGLKAALSSPDEGAASNIPTISYDNASYTSQYLTFDGVETADRTGKQLRSIDPADKTAMTPYNPNASIPWLYWGTGFQVGASFPDYQLMAGKKASDIAGKLADPTSAEAKAVLGAANVHTAQLCKLTNGQPANVCSAAGVQAAAKLLG